MSIVISRRGFRAVLPLIFLAVALLCYWPSLNGEFLWDDENLILANRWIKSPALTGEIFRHWLHPDSTAPYYRPIQTLTLAVDYYLWGANTTGYHLTNILLHAASGYLLYLLLTALSRQHSNQTSRFISLAPLTIAVIWTLHPIHNAAVAYIAGRADAMGMMLAICAWLLAMRGLASGGIRSVMLFAAGALLMLLALLSKEISSVWMGLFTIYLFVFCKNVSLRRKLAIVAGLLMVTAAWALMRTLPVEAGASPQTVQTSWPQRTVLVTRAIGDYASLLVAPTDLHMERAVWPDWNRHEISWVGVPGKLGVLGYVGLFSILGVMAACFWKSDGRRLRIAGAVWFGICFLPVSNLFPLNAQVAEHWIYVASIGAFLFAAGCCVTLPQRFVRVAATLAVCWAAALIVRTNMRAAEWSDPVVFYQQTIAAMGGTPRVFNNLGVSLSERGRVEDAERVYRYALQRYPSHPALLSNLGTTLMKLDRREAADEFLEAAKESSDGGAAGDHRAQARSVATQARLQLMDENAGEALKMVADLRQQLPERWDLLKLEAEALLETEGTGAAIAAVESYVARHWYSIEAHAALGRLWYRHGDPEKALRSWKQAARLDVWAREPWSEMAKIEAERKNLTNACTYQQEAVDRSPGDAMARMILAKFLKDAGKDVDAAVALMDARELSAKGKQ